MFEHTLANHTGLNDGLRQPLYEGLTVVRNRVDTISYGVSAPMNFFAEYESND